MTTASDDSPEQFRSHCSLGSLDLLPSGVDLLLGGIELQREATAGDALGPVGAGEMAGGCGEVDSQRGATAVRP